jgi:hypothetical protein
MAVSHQRVTVSTTAVALNTASGGGERLLVVNASANAADLGASNVTAGAGYSLAANAAVALDLDPGDVVYAIRSGASDAVLGLLRT